MPTEAQSETPLNLPTMARFEGPSFELMVPAIWSATASPLYQAAFIGPMIGRTRASITVTMQDRPEQVDTAEWERRIWAGQEAMYPKFTLIDSLVQDDRAWHTSYRHFRWYNATIDMVIFHRQQFLVTDTHGYLLTSTQPNNPRLQIMDAVFMEVFNSFRAGNLKV